MTSVGEMNPAPRSVHALPDDRLGAPVPLWGLVFAARVARASAGAMAAIAGLAVTVLATVMAPGRAAADVRYERFAPALLPLALAVVLAFVAGRWLGLHHATRPRVVVGRQVRRADAAALVLGMAGALVVAALVMSMLLGAVPHVFEDVRWNTAASITPLGPGLFAVGFAISLARWNARGNEADLAWTGRTRTLILGLLLLVAAMAAGIVEMRQGPSLGAHAYAMLETLAVVHLAAWWLMRRTRREQALLARHA